MKIFRDLVGEADVVVENYRPDVKDRLGIDYDSLAAINPRIILASISGFGQQGPAGFGGGLNFAMAPNSLYYPNMRGGGYAGLGGFPYTGGGMNFGGGFPGQQQYGGGGFGGGGFGGGYGQFQNPLMGFGNMGGFANFNNTTQNYMNQFQNRPQMGGQSGSWGNWGNQGRNMYNRAPYF